MGSSIILVPLLKFSHSMKDHNMHGTTLDVIVNKLGTLHHTRKQECFYQRVSAQCRPLCYPNLYQSLQGGG
ncbi:hypothetical protein Hanom_Chr10g00957201 [Helianthus anomalus]